MNTEQSRPFISVVIPTLNRPRALFNCLSALAGQSYPKSLFEVIVVDDGGSADLDSVTSPLRDKIDLNLFRQPNAGPGAARNTGVTQARGNLLAFTDDDCIPEPQWLDSFAAGHQEHPDALLGGSTTVLTKSTIYSRTAQLIIDSAYRYYNSGSRGARFFATNNLATPTAAFRDLGGFDASFTIASEDRDFCHRWCSENRPVRLVAKAAVCHAKELRLASYVRQYFRYGQGAWQYHRAHRGDRAPLPDGSGSHLAFLRLVWSELNREAQPGKIRAALPLVLWQASNLAGYGYAATRSWFMRKPP